MVQPEKSVDLTKERVFNGVNLYDRRDIGLCWPRIHFLVSIIILRTFVFAILLTAQLAAVCNILASAFCQKKTRCKICRQ